MLQYSKTTWHISHDTLGMILVTGGTGFIGQALIRHLSEAGYEVRMLIRPSPDTPNLPKGVPMEVAVSGLNDPRGLQAAMVGVDTIFHLAGGEWHGVRANLLEVDIQGTRTVSQTAAAAGVERLFFLSHLGADRASAYPVLTTKAIAEDHIRRSGVDYTIFRSGLIFGENDNFTTDLARLLHAAPSLFLIPGDGSTLIQPLWVEDLVTCLVWALEDRPSRNKIFEVGGPEQLTFEQVVQFVMASIGIERSLIPIKPPYLRALTVVLESIFPGLPVSVFWLDYLATNRTCAIDVLPKTFGLMPTRFSYQLDYLKGKNWRREFWSALRQGPG